MDDCPSTRVPRDGHEYNFADAIHGLFPSRAFDLSSADMRGASIPSKRAQESKSSKRKGTSDSEDYSRPSISLPRHGYWAVSNNSKRGRSQNKQNVQMDLHQSTCLNLNGPDNADSDLWILPDFDEWELDAESSQQLSMKRDGEWAPLVERAVNSNRERLRRRLEGDGWDFVGGKYGEDGKMHEAESGSEESVDEEFDVVILPVVEVSC